MTTTEINELAKHIFEIHSGIEHLGLIDLEGHVVLDKAAAASTPNDFTIRSVQEEPDESILMRHMVKQHTSTSCERRCNN